LTRYRRSTSALAQYLFHWAFIHEKAINLIIMEHKIELVKKYFALVEAFCADKKEYENILHPEMTATEYPNLNTKATRTRGYNEMFAGMETAKKILRFHHIEIHAIFETPEVAVVEATWTGEMAEAVRDFEKGQTLTAHCCFVFEFKDGRIFRQRNYDCYESFE
jgi:ketosteroid isomerase-like protein